MSIEINFDKSKLDKKKIEGREYLKCPQCKLWVKPDKLEEHYSNRKCREIAKNGLAVKVDEIIDRIGAEFNVRAENVAEPEDDEK